MGLNNMPLSKEIRILEVLAQHPQGLTKLEAIQHGDTCINTTISKLQSKHRLAFDRTTDLIHDRFGGKTKFVRYRLSGEQRELALSIVKRERDKVRTEAVSKKTL